LNPHEKTIYFAPLKFISLVPSQSLFNSRERVGGKVKELCRKIRRYQKMLERAYLEKKGNYFRGKN
jgi:hypothetical protein